MTRWLSGIALGLALSGCGGPRPRAPQPQGPAVVPSAPVVAPVAPPSATAELPLPAPTSSAPPVMFQLGAPIRFKSGAGLKPKLVAKDAEALALAPDGRSYAYRSGDVVKLVTPEKPAGYELPGVVTTHGSFSPDGSLFVLWDSSITVVEVATGKKRLEVEGYGSCALRFTPDNALVLQGEAFAGNDWLAPLWRVAIAPGSVPVALGPKRFIRECQAAPDGERFIAVFPTPYQLVDGKSGRSRVLPIPEDSEVTFSPTADRYCVASTKGDAADLTCTRLTDGGSEVLLLGASYPTVTFELGGRRALVERTLESPRGDISREMFLADFSSATLRRVVGFEGKSGAIRQLLPGGQLLTQGSSRGQMVYDLERGEKRFMSVPRLYGTEAMAGHERRFFADAETFGGQDNAELYFVEVP